MRGKAQEPTPSSIIMLYLDLEYFLSTLLSPILLAQICSLGFIMTDTGQYGFEGRTWKLYLVDKGWMVLAIIISGILHTYL